MTPENIEILNLERWAELFKGKDQKKIDEELELYQDTLKEFAPEVSGAVCGVCVAVVCDSLIISNIKILILLLGLSLLMF